jgi:hypothetical protein
MVSSQPVSRYISRYITRGQCGYLFLTPLDIYMDIDGAVKRKKMLRDDDDDDD